MRISNSFPDPLIGCQMFPEDGTTEEFGYGFEAPAAPFSITDIDSGLDAPGPPPLDPNDPDHLSKIKSGL